jgi:hypothetical protein
MLSIKYLACFCFGRDSGGFIERVRDVSLNNYHSLYLFRWQRKNAIFSCQQGGE